MAKPDLSGERIGMLVVQRRTNSQDRYGSWLWECLCDCGKTTMQTRSELLRGRAKLRNCGCYCHKTSHSLSGSAEHVVWKGMKQRCSNPNHIGFLIYGGRGIKVCERWENSFADFLADMGPRPLGDNYSVERRNNDGDYTPENCYWATGRQQAANKRNSHLIEFDGVKATIVEWFRKLNPPFAYSTIVTRLARGLPPQTAFFG